MSKLAARAALILIGTAIAAIDLIFDKGAFLEYMGIVLAVIAAVLGFLFGLLFLVTRAFPND